MENKFKPKIIHIDLTGKCNFRCLHCRGRVDENNEISKEKLMLILNQIIENWSDEIEWIELGGGEPLLYPYLSETISFIKTHTKFKIILVTNAFFCSKEKLLELKLLGLDRIQFSLDGSTEKTHNYIRQNKLSYFKVLAAAKICKEIELPFVLRLTITNINKLEIEDFFKLSKNLGASEVGLRGCIYTGYANSNEDDLYIENNEYFNILKELPNFSKKYHIHYFSGDPIALVANTELLKEVKRIYGTYDLYGGCSVGISYMYFNNVGNIAFCPMLNQIELADPSKEKIIDIWNNSKDYNIMRKRAFEGKCGSCTFKKLCGGCRAYSYWKFKELYKDNPICIFNN